MQRRIAYVEGNVNTRANYAELLAREGLEIEPHASKELAICAFSKRLPDLALLNVSLDGDPYAGLQLCVELRRLSRRVPIILLTSNQAEAVDIPKLRLGADDYVPKDSSVEHIVVRIEALLRRLDAVRINEPRETTL